MAKRHAADQASERSSAFGCVLALATALALFPQSHSRAAQPEVAERAFLEALGRGDTAALLRFADGAQGFQPTEALRVGDTPLGLSTKLGNGELVRRLLVRGADPNAADASGWTPLAVAVTAGRADLARSLVEHGARSDANLPGGITLASMALSGSAEIRQALGLGTPDGTPAGRRLLAAIEAGDDAGVAAALSAGARADAVDQEGVPLLVSAALNGRTAAAARLLEAGAPVDQPAPGRITALIAAATAGQVDTARLLLERGASTMFHSASGATALDAAYASGVPTAARLLETASLRQRPEVGRRLLAQAAGRGDEAEVRDLLRRGVPVAGPDGPAALLAAAFKGHAAVVRVLLDAGADPSAADRGGNTPLHAAALGGHVQVARVLLERGAAAGAANAQGLTPLAAAVAGGHPPVAEAIQARLGTLAPADLLLAARSGDAGVLRANYRIIRAPNSPAGADGRLHEGRTLLAVAAGAGQVAAVDALLEAGANPDGAPEQRASPIATAAAEGQEATVRRLIAAGAEPFLRPFGGPSAREAARQRGRAALEPVLAEAERRRAREISQALASFEEKIVVDDQWSAQKQQALLAFQSNFARYRDASLNRWFERADRATVRVCNASGQELSVAVLSFPLSAGVAEGSAEGWFVIPSGECFLSGERAEGWQYAVYATRPSGAAATRPAPDDPSACIRPNDVFDHGPGTHSAQACRGRGKQMARFSRVATGDPRTTSGLVTLR